MNMIQNLLFSFLILLIFSIPSFLTAQCSVAGGTIVVTNTNDEGAGSLREAINCANATQGPNVISFDIPGTGEQRILVGSTSGAVLPSLVDPGTVIDGSTQNGFGDTDFFPKIILDGSQTIWDGPYNAIFVLADNCEIYGLEIIDFPDDAIDVYNADNVIIGGPDRGNIIYRNGIQQDVFPGFNGNWEGCAIVLRTGADNCIVQGNILGTDRFLTPGIGGEFCGIINRSGANFNLIGGAAPGAGNIIAYHPTGIRVDNSGRVRIQQNQMYCNDTIAIQLTRNANSNKPAPSITNANIEGVTGTASPNDLIEVFISDNSCVGTPCQGKTYLGSTLTDNNGNWSLTQPFVNGVTLNSGDQVTATATDQVLNTSIFASCQSVIDVSSCASVNGTILVTNTNDEGLGSLRSAIDCANSTQGANTIAFDIPGGGPHRIFVGSTSGEGLPALLDARTTIDGTTQAGFGAGDNFRPRIILDGSQHNWTKVINAIWVRADYCNVYALEITNFPDDGIDVTAANFAKIGDVNKGNVIYNNGSPIDFFPETSGGPWEGCAVVLKLGAENCVVRGNYLGTDYFQNNTSGNEYCGVVVNNGGDNNIIGGTQPGQGNIIANNAAGVRVGQNSFNTRIQGNSFYCNDTIAIDLRVNANNGHPAPVISDASATSIAGTATANDLVEIYLNDNTGCPDAVCQGKFLLGFTFANSNGSWSLSAPFNGLDELSDDNVITAISTDVLGNTSPFADCRTAQTVVNCNMTAIIRNAVNPSCNQNNGSFRVVTGAGEFPYFYDIGNGASNNPNFTNLSPGTYEVTVTDDNGCQAIRGITLAQSNQPVANISNIQDASCGQANGLFSITVSGGQAPFIYNYGNGGQNSGTFSNLLSGTYVVTVTDGNNCTTVEEVVLNDLAPPTASIENQINASCDQEDASFSVAVSGGTGPYNYDIGAGVTSSSTFSSLSPGTYFVTVTDANNCQDVVSATLTGGTAPDASIAALQEAGCNRADGSFSLSIQGGTAPFTFDIGNGSTSNGTFSNLESGTYTVTITDSNGCEDIEGVTIGMTSPPRGNINSVQQATCGQSNGSFSINVQGGTAPFQYDIGSGFGSEETFTNLPAATYVVTIRDANGCENIQGITIGNSAPPSLSIQNINNANCGATNGSITISVSGGRAPYSFDIGNGATSSNIFNNLAPGDYTVSVIDGNNCSSTIMATVQGANPPSVSLRTVSNATCGQANGSFTLDVSGGTAPYSFNYGQGVYNSNVTENLAAGNYSVTITDGSNCSVTQTVSIQAGQAITASFTNIQQPSCSGNDGAFRIEVQGGTSPFQFNMGNGNISNNSFTNLSNGAYTITITDADNCVTTESISLTGDATLDTNASNVKPPACGENNGSFTVTANGGQAPYRYDIGLGATSRNNFDNLSPGLYEVTVTDSGNCSAVETVSFENAGRAPIAGFTYEKTDRQVVLTNNSQRATFISWTFGDGSESTDYNPTYTYADDGQYTICLNIANDCGSDVSCSNVNIGDNIDPRANISGAIKQEDGTEVDLVTVNCTNLAPMETDFSGTFSFNELRAANDTYTITPFKDINHNNGVSTFDLVTINKHIIDVERLDSPYKQIAADVNKSGSISVLDLIILRKVILNIQNDFGGQNTSWRFIPTDYVFENPENPLREDFPESITLNLNQDITNANFVGIKIGDVNNSAIQGRSQEVLAVKTQEQYFVAGEELEVNLSTEAAAAILGLQGTLTYDDSILEAITEQPQAENGFEGAIGFPAQGHVTGSWLQTATVEHSSFTTLKFRALRAGKLSEVLALTSYYTQAEAYLETADEVSVNPLVLEFTTTDAETSNNIITQLGNYPNPFQTQTTISFTLTQAETVQLSILNVKGHLMERVDLEGIRGANEYRFRAPQGAASGVFYYQLRTSTETQNGRMILLKD